MNSFKLSFLILLLGTIFSGQSVLAKVASSLSSISNDAVAADGEEELKNEPILLAKEVVPSKQKIKKKAKKFWKNIKRQKSNKRDNGSEENSNSEVTGALDVNNINMTKITNEGSVM